MSSLRDLVLQGLRFGTVGLAAEILGAPFWVALTAIIAVVPAVSWVLGRYWAFR